MKKQLSPENKEIRKIFVTAFGKIQNPLSWSGAWKARNANNLAMNPRDVEAVKFSIDGALIRALFECGHDDSKDEIYIKCFNILEQNCNLNSKGEKKFQDFNDSRNHSDILKVYQKIIDGLGA